MQSGFPFRLPVLRLHRAALPSWSTSGRPHSRASLSFRPGPAFPRSRLRFPRKLPPAARRPCCEDGGGQQRGRFQAADVPVRWGKLRNALCDPQIRDEGPRRRCASASHPTPPIWLINENDTITPPCYRLHATATSLYPYLPATDDRLGKWTYIFTSFKQKNVWKLI